MGNQTQYNTSIVIPVSLLPSVNTSEIKDGNNTEIDL